MKTILAATALLLLASPLMAEPEPPRSAPGRYEVWLGASGWPALRDLRPAAGTGFDTTGWGLGGAFHAPVRQFENSVLLAGFDGFIVATGSDISGVIDDMLARHLYLGTSIKWFFGPQRNLSFDAGLGYHLLDMAQVSSEYIGLEHQAWEEDGIGAFVGATWDVAAGRDRKAGGLSLALKVHFVDFGVVRDEATYYTRLLGENAGKLNGPLYVLQIGYSGR